MKIPRETRASYGTGKKNQYIPSFCLACYTVCNNKGEKNILFVELLTAPSSVEFMVPPEISHLTPLKHKEVDHSVVRGGRSEFLLSSEATLDLHYPNKKNFRLWL